MIFFLFQQVIDIKGHIFYQKEDITKGKFAFTADHFDTFQICFQSHVSPGIFSI